MKEKIERFSKCEFAYELPSIFLSEEKLESVVIAGMHHEGSFTISNSSQSEMNGLLYSSSQFVHIKENRFVGKENIICYQVDATHLERGRKIEGDINIISDCGEIKLPFVFEVKSTRFQSSIGEIKDLFQFTNLAVRDWQEALQLFCSHHFISLLKHQERKQSLIYKALCLGSDMNQAMNEFLIATRKKNAVKISLDRYELVYEAEKHDFMEQIMVYREGFGYFDLTVTTNASFLKLEKQRLDWEGFVNNCCPMNYVVCAEGQKEGIHYGSIVFHTIVQTIQVPVKLICVHQNPEMRSLILGDKKCQVRLLQNYIDFRCNRKSILNYINDAKRYLLGLSEQNSIIWKLYEVHILAVSGEEQEAKKQLELLYEHKISTQEPKTYEYGIYLYLKAFLARESTDLGRVKQQLVEIQSQNNESYLLIWCLLYLDKSYEYNKQEKYEFIRIQCERNCNSPVLYYEAAALLSEDASLLKELCSPNLRILAFAVRRQIMNKELARHISYLAVKSKEQFTLLLWILDRLYIKYHLRETLEAICTLLVRGRRKDASAFLWYQKGIEEKLRITELPEHYLYAIGEEYLELPSSILAYFLYNNKLPDIKKAYLFANIVTNREKYQTTYPSYEKQIQYFVLNMLKEKHINKDMAVLYNEVLPRMLNQEIAQLLPDILFYYELTCEQENIKRVIVTHQELKEEKSTSLVKGRAYVELFTENAEIILCDEEKRRYHSTIKYAMRQLIHLNDILLSNIEYQVNHTKLFLYLCSKGYHNRNSGSVKTRLLQQMVELPQISEEVKQEKLQELIFYFYDNYNGELLECYLRQIDLSYCSHDIQKKIVEMMILRDLFEPVINYMKCYGFLELDVKRLLKLCSRVIRQKEGQESPEEIILRICHYVFEHGKYDETILHYQVLHYYGTTKEMHDLWVAARNFDVDTMRLEEHLLVQMLFSESYLGISVPVFMSYYRGGFHRKLIRAFLSYYAYKYLVKDRIPDPEVFDVMRKEAGYERNEIYLLALLKYYSTKETKSDSEIKFSEYYMNEFWGKQIILPFYKDFHDSVALVQYLNDKVFIEYHTDPNKKVILHYCLCDNENTDYHEEEMVHVCYGIYVKEFVLFAQENLQYYITQEDTMMLSGNITTASEELVSEESKFYQLNLILEARELSDEVTTEMLLEQYICQDYIVRSLFHPIYES